jgi:hypothetical protein
MMNRFKPKVLINLAFVLPLLFAPAIAADTKQYQSEWIGVGRYMGYKADPSATSPDQVMAQFSFVRTLKGPPYALRMLRVRYTRRGKVKQDDQGTIDLLSQVPNRANWIIFIQYMYTRNGGLDSFNGNKGIIPCNKKNLDDVLDSIEREGSHPHLDEEARRALYDDDGLDPKPEQ